MKPDWIVLGEGVEVIKTCSQGCGGRYSIGTPVDGSTLQRTWCAAARTMTQPQPLCLYPASIYSPVVLS
jgi:hypothetical protein